MPISPIAKKIAQRLLPAPMYGSLRADAGRRLKLFDLSRNEKAASEIEQLQIFPQASYD